MKRRIKLQKRWLVFTSILLLSVSLVPMSEASANQAATFCGGDIKVMPLGDSITSGKYSGHDTTHPGAFDDDIGYRKDLWDLLDAAGFNVDFVGTKSNGIEYPFSDPDHEGHNGETDAFIAYHIYNNGGQNWLSLNPPDMILLHIGTNYIDTDPSYVENILDEIDEFEVATGRRVIVLLARIIDWVPNNPVVHQFNNAVENMAEGRTEFGVDLFVVDMEDGAGIKYSIWDKDTNPDGDMIDNLHPYATGFSKMARVWMEAIDNLCYEVYLPLVYKNYSVKKHLWG